jgi:hypothetical protein
MKTRMNWGDIQPKDAKMTIGARGELLLHSLFTGKCSVLQGVCELQEKLQIYKR